MANLSTILVAAALALAVGFVVFGMIRRNKKGDAGCGCGCDHCAMGGVCKGVHGPNAKGRG